MSALDSPFVNFERFTNRSILNDSRSCQTPGVSPAELEDLSIIKNGIEYRLITDQLGSVRLVVNADNGSIAQQLDYDEFGRVLNDSNPGFQPFGFAGGLIDPGTGLVHFGARDYAPDSGRWSNQDPIGEQGGINLYAYVVHKLKGQSALASARC